MPDATAPPAITVVVSTYNRAESLDRLLRALADQTLDASQFEVVVVDDASTDTTPEVVRHHARTDGPTVTLVRQEHNRGPAVGRNAGSTLAQGQVIAYTDDDCVPSAGWLAAVLTAFEGRDDRVVVGRVLPEPGHTFGPYTRSLRVEKIDYFQTANTSYPRALLDRLGGFDERYRRPGGEDTDLGLRAIESGATAVFARDALVHHAVYDFSLREALRLARRWIDIGRVVKRHPHMRDAWLHRRWFWKPSHPPTIVALLGLAMTPVFPPALLAGLWWGHHRLRRSRRPHRSRRELLATLPGVFLVDATEVLTMVRASARARTVIL